MPDETTAPCPRCAQAALHPERRPCPDCGAPAPRHLRLIEGGRADGDPPVPEDPLDVAIAVALPDPTR